MHKVTIKTELPWLVVLIAGLCAIYVPGLNNALVFDDVRMLDGRQIWAGYGAAFELKQRWLSYSSFVWIEQLFGAGWWKQRVVNVVLHALTAYAAYALLRQLLQHADWTQAQREKPHFELSVLLAAQLGALLFAFNPVAVYAVGYLVQRSIVMATLFAVLALSAFVWGLGRTSPGKRIAAWGLALVLYGAAVLSKEYALFTPAAALAMYLFIRRPRWQRAVPILLVCALAVGAVVAWLMKIYGGLVGTVFDELSRSYIAELTALDPLVMDKAWGFSILNQMALFFAYMFLWLAPVVSWMSIDLRPPFPLSWLSWPHVLGALLYVALLLVTTVRLLRNAPGIGRFISLCLLVPALLFATEFATVWIQDPFVLYRSYLWAFMLPGLLVVVLAGVRPGVLAVIGSVLMMLFGALAFERVLSMQTKLSVWDDASVKTQLFDSPGAVGRWRPFMNKGAYFLENDMAEPAVREFERAVQLGERRGHAHFNLGIALHLQKRYEEAIAAFDEAESRGATSFIALYLNRGEARLALGRLPEAQKDFLRVTSMARPGEAEVKHNAAKRLVQIALATGDYAGARDQAGALLAETPDDYELLLNRALSRAALGENEAALSELDALLQRGPNPSAFYGRAIALHQLGRNAEALQAIDRAMVLQPGNPNFFAFRQRITAALQGGGQTAQ